MKNNKGFTLTELLIVVAIIAVLVAISIPIFTGQLKKTRLATNQANARAGYAAAMVKKIENKNEPKVDEDEDYIVEGYIYDVESGIAEYDPNPSSDGTSKPIQEWEFGLTIGKDKYGNPMKAGDGVATKWYIVFSEYVGDDIEPFSEVVFRGVEED